MERSGRARLRPARGCGLVGPVDWRRGRPAASKGVPARVLAQNDRRRSPVPPGPAVRHRSRPLPGVPRRAARRRHRARARLHPVPCPRSVPGLRRHLPAAAGTARARRPAGRRLVPRPGRDAACGGAVRRRGCLARAARGADPAGLAGHSGQRPGLARRALPHHCGRPHRRPAGRPPAARSSRARPQYRRHRPRRPAVASRRRARRRRRRRPVHRASRPPDPADPAGRRPGHARGEGLRSGRRAEHQRLGTAGANRAAAAGWCCRTGNGSAPTET